MCDEPLETVLIVNRSDGLSMIGVTAGGQVLHTRRKAGANYSIRASAKADNDCSCHLEKEVACEETKESADCSGVLLLETKLCKCKLASALFGGLPFKTLFFSIPHKQS